MDMLKHFRIWLRFRGDIRIENFASGNQLVKLLFTLVPVYTIQVCSPIYLYSSDYPFKALKVHVQNLLTLSL